jgi:hypothetical protein
MAESDWNAIAAPLIAQAGFAAPIAAIEPPQAASPPLSCALT